MKVVALIPSHNEEQSISDTIKALLTQTRVPDRIVVLSDNSTDDTLKIAQSFPWPVTAVATKDNKHKKSGALNYGWNMFCQDADIVISFDADTVVLPNAVGDWEKELSEDQLLGGSAAKFTMPAPGLLSRLQKAEFSRSVDVALRRKKTSVLPGAGTAFRNVALKRIAVGREGPWSYTSQVEDFELTHQLRKLGYNAHVSPTIRAYTDSMKTVRSLWSQRMKWSTGTAEDLLTIGFNKLTAFEWLQQFKGLIALFSRLLWVAIMIPSIVFGYAHWSFFYLILPGLAVACDLRAVKRVPHRDWKDVLIAGSFIIQEIYTFGRVLLFGKAWCAAIRSKITGKRKDRWALQYRSEGSTSVSL